MPYIFAGIQAKRDAHARETPVYENILLILIYTYFKKSFSLYFCSEAVNS